jgi:hypothetical protein
MRDFLVRFHLPSVTDLEINGSSNTALFDARWNQLRKLELSCFSPEFHPGFKPHKLHTLIVSSYVVEIDFAVFSESPLLSAEIYGLTNKPTFLGTSWNNMTNLSLRGAFVSSEFKPAKLSSLCVRLAASSLDLESHHFLSSVERLQHLDILTEELHLFINCSHCPDLSHLQSLQLTGWFVADTCQYPNVVLELLKISRSLTSFHLDTREPDKGTDSLSIGLALPLTLRSLYLVIGSARQPPLPLSRSFVSHIAQMKQLYELTLANVRSDCGCY